MKVSSSSDSARLTTAVGLVLANLVPLFGVLLFDWEVASLLFVYWLENIVAGVHTVLKIAQAPGLLPIPAKGASPGPTDEQRQSLARPRVEVKINVPLLAGTIRMARAAARGGSASAGTLSSSPVQPNAIAKVLLIPIFIVHFGLFTLAHGVFLYVLLGRANFPWPQPLITHATLFVSQGVSSLRYFIGRGDLLRVSSVEQMQEPHGRVGIMHGTIMIGVLLFRAFNVPPIFLVVLILLKIGVDLAAHNRCHARFSLPEARSAV
jgi:hypothetical protein